MESRASRAWASIHAHARAERTQATVRHVCLACVQAAGASGAGLAIANGTGLLEPMFATDEHTEELEELQFTLGQGPGFDGAGSPGPVLVADVSEPDAQRRWPLFAAAVAERGFRAIFAFPVATGAARFGVLDLYRRSAGPLSSDELADTLAYSDAVLALALYDRGGLPADVNVLGHGDFADHHAEVHQAAGMISVQLGISVVDGLARLRAYAFVNDRALADVAADIVARQLRFSPDEPGPTRGSGSSRPPTDGNGAG